MKNLFILFSFIIANTALLAQNNDYYIYKGQKRQVEINYDYLYVASSSQLNYNSLFNSLNYQIEIFKEGEILPNINDDPQNWKVIKINNTHLNKANHGQLVSELKKGKVDYVGPVIGNQYPVALSNYFYVKLKQQSDYSLLVQYAKQTQCKIIRQVKYMPHWYVLKCDKNSKGNTLELSNQFNESSLFADTDPGFMPDFSKNCITDTDFSQQWGLDNTTNPDADINACQAWNVTIGSNNVIVAVIDQGIELTHNEFSDNLFPISFDTETETSPSVVYADHGTHVAGIIGANQNGNQVSGVAPNSLLMSVSNSLGLANVSEELAVGFSWAWQNGASIINNSWGDQGGFYFNQLQSTLLEDAIMDALTLGRNGLGTIVVFASGNFNTVMDYPAYFTPEILSVGSITSSGVRSSFSGYANELDIVAPGSGILSTVLSNNTGTKSGTSMAAPHACGVAALVLSVNHNLTRQEVTDIIEASAQKLSSYTYATTTGRPNGTWENETGYGLLDAEAAVLDAQSLCTSTQIDLFSKDWHDDFGLEPNIYTSSTYTPTTHTPTAIWISEDIWVRNLPDGIANQEHQNPEYNFLNYVYVRVRNRGCVASNGTEVLHLHWAKANTTLTWPNNWDGSTDLDPPNNAIAGNLIGTPTIPVILPGGEAILEIWWNPPNPDDYAFNDIPWHFCLLSRIVTANDPITTFSNIGSYVTENNNVAWKNLMVVDNIPGIIVGDCPEELMQNIGVSVAVANPYNQPETFDITFSVPNEELGNPITAEGNVMVALDDQLYQKWMQGGKKGTGINEILSPPMSNNGANNNQINTNSPITVSNRKMFEIIGPSSSFDNITLDADELRIISMMVIYPTNPVSTKQKFNYDIIEKRTANGEVIGGVRYEIRKPTNNDPPTDAGNNKTIKRGCSTTLTATPLKNCYVYFWLNEQGNIISQEPNITVSPNKTTTYTLKIVSSEGFVSIDNVTVTVLNQLCQKEREIIRITPNPAKDRVTVKYRTKNTNSAHLRLVKTDNSIDRTYNLNLQMTEIMIDVSDCTFGSYAITLVCDNIIEDSKTLIIH